MSNSNEKKPGILGRFLSQRGMGQVITVGVGLVILCLVFGFINPNFFTYRNVANLLRQIAPILLIGVGQSYVLFTGNIDLSVGSVVGMSCMISATLMCHGMNPWVSVVITMACCLAVGCVNGVLVSKCKLPPFIATLGTMTIARGIAQIVKIPLVRRQRASEPFSTAANSWGFSVHSGLRWQYGWYLTI